MSSSIHQEPGLVRVETRLSPVIPASLIVAGVLITWLFSTIYTVECTRIAPDRVDARIRRLTPGCAPVVLPVSDVRGAVIQSGADLDHTSRQGWHRTRREGLTVEINDTHRVALVDGSGTFYPVSDAFTIGLRKHTELRDAVRRFLADPQSKRLIARQAPNSWALAFLLLSVLGLVLVVLSRGVCVLDARTGIVRLTRSVWLPLERVVPLAEVQRFETSAPWTQRFNGNERRAVEQPVLIDRRGKPILLTWCWAGGTEGAFAAARALEKARVSALSGPPSTPISVSSPAVEHPSVSASPPAKICVLCGRDCGDSPRYQDESGRYYHRDCHHKAVLDGSSPSSRA